MILKDAPIRAKITDKDLLTMEWLDWFSQLYNYLFASLPSMGLDNGDNNVTLLYSSSRTQAFNTPLTAIRTITLPAVHLFNGLKFRIVRQSGATGAFNLAVGSVTTLTAANQWCDIEYNGVTWVLTGKGTL